jgi:putative ABC transport system substrate-binding protein
MWMALFMVGVLASAVCGAPSLTAGQPAGKVYQVGVLGTREGPSTPALRQGFHELGYVEGRNIVITYRWSEGKPDRFPALAAELVNLNMDVIVASGPPAAVAAKAATTSIPIVFTLVGDPVGLGPVASLPRPGGNVTGLSSLVDSGPFTQKQLQLLKEMVPGAIRVAVLRNPGNPIEARGLPHTMAAAEKLGLAIQVLEARTPEDIGRAFEAARQGRAGAIHVHGDPMFGLHRTRIVALAATHRLPARYFSHESVLAGGLMSYGPNTDDLLRRVAGYADRILRGARPGDLPGEQPTKFDLFINLKTARELGVAVPPSLRLRADHVVE